ncbi:MAG: asparagine synthase (glutamine-hydrolyzing) [Planctomycetes bacterium]|nr:asparagine synthase (glutamine-hydrolyzing) [Planctomycetota bacterium]
MCGLCGFLTPGPLAEESEAILGPMTETLRHRGPDDSGLWTDRAAGVALGHRRLSILDLSPLGHQPMESACGRYVAAFNGEIYNFADLRKDLEGRGHKFRGHSDTEIMLSAFTEWGLAGALPRFNGMFAIALWDRRDRTLSLVRDRLGEKPLYYGWCGDSFLFGSELKALRAHPRFKAEINREALALYLRHNYVPAPLSIYSGILKLPAATIVTVDPRRPGLLPEPLPYWSAKEQAGLAASADSEEQLSRELEDLLRDAVRLRMHADVPLGAFLSGGVDSSAIVALMQAQSSRPVRTFSIGFREEGYNEAEDAARVARHLKTDHTELYVTPAESQAVIPLLPRLYDEPFSDSSQIPTFLVSRLARQSVTVSLSGDGGDELFGGYNRYLLGQRIWRRVGWLPRPLRSLAGRAIRTVPRAAWDAVMKVFSLFLEPGARKRRFGEQIHKLGGVMSKVDPEAMYLGLISHWNLSDGVVLGAPRESRIPFASNSWPKLPDFTQKMMLMDLLTYLPDDILVKVDRASMGVGLEARVPFLDHRLVEFSLRLPLSFKIREGTTKWILRQVLCRHVPKELIERPKMGFGVPIDAWLRGPLRDWAEDLLGESRLRREGYFDPAPIRERWEAHVSGRQDWHYHLWDILMFQAWLGSR